jgi:poly(A) polymerase
VNRLLDHVRAVLGGHPAWIVGGAVRDELLGRETDDYDIAVEDDPRSVARAVARAAGGAAFPLSEAFGAWRVVGPRSTWRLDLVGLVGGGLEQDLAARDFTINAMARPLAGGGLIDPHGGARDLRAGRLRMVSERALVADPLRTMRAVRFAVEFGFELEADTARAVAANAEGLAGVAQERVFGELRRVIGGDRPADGLRLMETLGLARMVLPELEALQGVEQNVFHHRDVHDHTLEVLEAVRLLERDPAAAGLGDHAPAVAAVLAEPLADEMTRGQAMRFAAILHDAAKPQTRDVTEQGRVTFIDHDAQGADLAARVMRRMRTSERLVDYVATLTRDHLRLGFMVHERPLGRRAVWRYMRDTAPYQVETTVFTVADRLATRGRDAEPAIAAHLELARHVLVQAVALRAHGAPAPLLRGDELMAALALKPGPAVGRLLAQLEEDRYVGEVTTREQALSRAAELLRTSHG